MKQFGAFIINYFNEMNEVSTDAYESIMDSDFDAAKSEINKLIYKLQELKKLLHDNNE